jgi:hypothetical protein
MNLLETTECIPIWNLGRRYTDCVEFSLLRFLHIVSAEEKDLFECAGCSYKTEIIEREDFDYELYAFITKYSSIVRKAEYYASYNRDGKEDKTGQFSSPTEISLNIIEMISVSYFQV